MVLLPRPQKGQIPSKLENYVHIFRNVSSRNVRNHTEVWIPCVFMGKSSARWENVLSGWGSLTEEALCWGRKCQLGSPLVLLLPPTQVLSGALTMALSRRCDADALRLLLELPEARGSRAAAEELCSLPGPHVYALIVSMSQNLNLRNVIYKVRG